MNGREFIDTNVLVYADDARDPHKQARARDLVRRLLRERRGVLSLQVLQEYFAASTRKLGLAGAEARRRGGAWKCTRGSTSLRCTCPTCWPQSTCTACTSCPSGTRSWSAPR